MTQCNRFIVASALLLVAGFVDNAGASPLVRREAKLNANGAIQAAADPVEEDDVGGEAAADPAEDDGLDDVDPPSSAVQHKQDALVHSGSNGNIQWNPDGKSMEPCRLAGTLNYEDMVMKFDISNTGILFEEEDGTVPFAAEKKDGSSTAVTVEGESFLQHTDARGRKSLIHLGSHHEHFHKVTSSSIAGAILLATNEKLNASIKLFRAKEQEMYQDKYDNAILELGTALAAQKISAVTHKCMFNLFNIYTKMQKNSKVVDEKTTEEMAKVEIRDDDSESLIAATSNVSKGHAQWGRRRRHRCPYNHCGNSKFGRCGDGWGLGCIWFFCMNCDCNRGCENHDDKCHCGTGCPVEDYGLIDLLTNRCSKCSASSSNC